MFFIKRLFTSFVFTPPKNHSNSLKLFFAFQSLFFFTHYRHPLMSTSHQKFNVSEEVKRKSKNKKIILVLDLDETMVYTRRRTKPKHENYKTIEFQGQDLYIQFRPYLFEFLQAVSQIFTLYVYTAGRKNYADLVLNAIDSNKIIQKRFYRESCRRFQGSFVKDLKKIKENENEMFLVDDNSDSVVLNHPYSVKIKKFEGDQSDIHLINIYKVLVSLYQS